MKLISLFCDFRPRLKCGADPVSAGVMAGGSLLGSIYSGEVSKENVQKQLNAQSRENQLNRDWQTEQAQLARNWQAGQTLQQNQFQTQLAAQQQQYNLQSMQQQAKYNSPVYMSQQLKAANIDPQVYFGNHASFQGSSAQAGGSPSAPSAGSASNVGSVSGLSPVGFQPLDLQIPQIMSGLGSMFKGLADAKKAGVETRFLEESFEERLQKVFAEGDMAQLDKVLKELDLKFQQENLPLKFKHAYANYKETLVKIDLLKQQALTEQEEQSLKRATSDLNAALQGLHEKEKERLGLTIQYLPRLLESEILSNRGAAAAGFASAEESKVKADQERIFNKIYNDKRYQHSIISQAVTAGQQAISQHKMTENQVKHLNYMIEQAAYANDMKEFTYWSGQIQSYIGSVGEAASAFYGAGALRELIKMRQLSRMPATTIQGFK